MAADLKISQPLLYYKKFLEQNVRPDERELGEIRPTTVNLGSIGTAEGSALVKLGDTTVVCGIKAELAAPTTEQPNKGYIVPNVELSPLCSSKFRPGPPSEQAQAACVFMDNIITNSNCLDLTSLCIDEGKLVWVLYCDMLCLNYDGNVLDACCIAMVGALRNTLLPKVTINEDSGLPETDLKTKVPLKVLSTPIATTLALFKENVLITDPTEEEEALSQGLITIVTLQDDKICLVNHTGGESSHEESLQKCFDRAKSRGKEVRNMLQELDNVVDR